MHIAANLLNETKKNEMKFRPKKIFSRFAQTEKFPDINIIKKNDPSLWERLKRQFDTGRQIVSVQLHNGLEKLNEQTIRLYLNDYARRYLKYGPNSFPTSFNVLEPFFTFNHHNSILELIDEEEAYGVSLVDFIDFVTEPAFDLKKIDLLENIPEKTICHFTFKTDYEEINFSNGQGKTFLIGSLSLVRQENEVSMLMQAGESFNKEEAEEYFRTENRKNIEDSITPYKKSLGLKIDYEGEPEMIHYLEREDLWLHSVAILFDLESKSIDIRHIARDENISYHIITDDFNAMFHHVDIKSDEEIKKRIEFNLKELEKYDAVFDFAKYCLALPYYVSLNEEKLIEVTYETSLNSLINGPIARRKYAAVPNSYKIYARPFYYLESNSQFVIESKELTDDSFKIEKSGYWKRIDMDEEGFDKKGRKIMGKTWVERNDIFYSNPKGITKATTIKENRFENKNAGYIYIMRQPTHEENIFKVGLTRRDLDKRKRELSNTSSVDTFFIINSYYTKDCIEAEKRIHKQLDKFRLTSRREFFRCNLKIILDSCETVIKEINK